MRIYESATSIAKVAAVFSRHATSELIRGSNWNKLYAAMRFRPSGTNLFGGIRNANVSFCALNLAGAACLFDPSTLIFRSFHQREFCAAGPARL